MTQQEAQEILALLEDIKELSEVDKITSTFVPAFKKKTIKSSGGSFLHGSFRLGGTKSARLSSAGPNLQQIPNTGSKYAKHIKRCVEAPKGYVFVGADFSSLEDRISALTTKDPNKLAPYIDGYDGHSLRAYAYFKDQMPDIEPTVESINSIGQKYPKLRQDSKMPTFALTYMGTWKTLVQNGGFSKEEAKKIETEYHRLYQVADQWVRDKLLEASKRGYVELAFGVRLYTPILPQVVMESSTGLPWEAHGEIKTAGNALGQSYGLLNTRAANEFMQRVWESEYKEQILPAAHIHDAQYFLIKNTLGCLKFVNDNLIDCMRWCELPEIQHPRVALEAKLEVFYPDWSRSYEIPNNLSIEELKACLKSYGL